MSGLKKNQTHAALISLQIILGTAGSPHIKFTVHHCPATLINYVVTGGALLSHDAARNAWHLIVTREDQQQGLTHEHAAVTWALIILIKTFPNEDPGSTVYMRCDLMPSGVSVCPCVYWIAWWSTSWNTSSFPDSTRYFRDFMTASLLCVVYLTALLPPLKTGKLLLKTSSKHRWDRVGLLEFSSHDYK